MRQRLVGEVLVAWRWAVNEVGCCGLVFFAVVSNDGSHERLGGLGRLPEEEAARGRRRPCRLGERGEVHCDLVVLIRKKGIDDEGEKCKNAIDGFVFPEMK